MTKHKVLCLPGDGVGPELIAATKMVLSATGIAFEYEEMDFGQSLQQTKGSPVVEDHLLAIERIGCVLKGPILIPSGKQASTVTLRGQSFTSPNQALRKLLSLYANVRPSRHFDGAGGRFPNTDIVVVRENTEGMYTGEEMWEAGKIGEVAVATRRITRTGALRIARFAFAFAKKHCRRRVTAAHKAKLKNHAAVHLSDDSEFSRSSCAPAAWCDIFHHLVQ